MRSASFVQEINRRQNEEDFLRLRRAADVAHGRGQWAEGFRAVIVTFFAGAAVVTSIAPSLTKPLAIAGVIGTVATELLVPLWSGHWSRLAMLHQERFDTDLFELPWNAHVGTRPLDEVAIELARAFKDDKKKNVRDWYVDVTRLPLAYAVLLCQRENLVWDFRQRRAWANWLATASAAWLSIGLSIALAFDWSVRDLFLRWIAPSLPLVVLGLRQAFQHRSRATTKQDAVGTIDSIVSRLPAGTPSAKRHANLLRQARELQDVIARDRIHSERVPQFVYRLRREAEEATARAVARETRGRLLESGV